MSDISARDTSILGLVARAINKEAARELIHDMELEAEQAALLIIGDISPDEVSERSRQLAKTATNWAEQRYALPNS